LDENTFSRLKIRLSDEIEESLIPYKADIVNFDKVSEEFKKNCIKEYGSMETKKIICV